MGKEGQLWDDSALVNAFDYAISKYKKMHGKGYTDDPSTEATQEDISNPETIDNENNGASYTSSEVQEAGILGTTTETTVTDSQITKEHDVVTDNLPPQDQSQNYPISNDLEEYTKLYNKYYELEEQRQKILQQMQNLNYPYSGEASISETNYATQEYQYTSQIPRGDPPSSKGFEEKSTVESADFVAIALEAAERALSTLKDKTLDAKVNQVCNVTDENANSETDLSTVLHAWYSAGFYTGKYLTEKSLAQKQPE